ncbi:dihydroneopterin aldolase [Sinorhizobium sp. BG8]|uniref:amino acid kinase family protein n=1 Tax=Sinorhizobium sp. BG8 TaxID=2613773 RepID=UPI00193CCBAB|nr:dihydroneopterin aldolase [Sinorhizobium sp. BG8]
MDAWIEALASATFPLVVVPGGGPFADLVRFTQKSMRFSDAAAHEMAILAMEQFGIAIAERHERLCTARSQAEIESALSRGRVPVWLPSAMTRAAPEIAQSWDVTSDSLAAWLARRLGAGNLLLIKQVDVDGVMPNLEQLVDKGIVDAMLPQLLGEEVALTIAGPAALKALRSQVPMTEVPGRHILHRQMAEGEIGR